MARDTNTSSGNQSSSDSQQSSRFDREAATGQGSSDRSSYSSSSDRSAQRENQSRRGDEQIRDHQQIADDNQQSGVVDTERMSNRASEMEQAEGSRENAAEDAGGISNRDLNEEEENQSRLPPRGQSKDGSHA